MDGNHSKATLSVCTDEINYHHFEQVHVKWDEFFEVQSMRKIASGGKYEFKESAGIEWDKEEKDIAKKHPRKRS